MFVFVVLTAAGVGAAALMNQPGMAIAGALIGIYFLFAIQVAEQWEKAAVLRLGRYRGLRGPGAFVIIPVIDSVSRFVDQRVRVTDVKAESALTRDTVPVNVDAIIFWLVWDAEKCILEVQDFEEAILLSAQTALRESIGRHELHQMVAEREMMGKELQRILDEKTTPWGITVQSVEIRDVQIRGSKTPCRDRRRPSVTAGAHHSGHRLPRSRTCSRRRARVSRQPGGTASTRHEHALRGDQGEGLDGHCAVVGGRTMGLRRLLGTAALIKQ
jgi:hypothetical protein